MPVLSPGVAQNSRRPTFVVENDLAVGSWLFRLTVVDDAGLESDPADIVVRVVAPTTGPVVGPGPVVRPPIVVVPGPVIRPVLDPVRLTPRSIPSPAGGSGGRRTRAPQPAVKPAPKPKAKAKAKPKSESESESKTRPAPKPRRRKKPKS